MTNGKTKENQWRQEYYSSGDRIYTFLGGGTGKIDEKIGSVKFNKKYTRRTNNGSAKVTLQKRPIIILKDDFRFSLLFSLIV